MDICIVKSNNTGNTESLDDALLDGTVVFKPKKSSTPTDRVLSEERLRHDVTGVIEEHKGFKLPSIEGFEFLSPFAHGCPGFWYVSDLHTGRKLIMNSCRTKDTAIRAVENCLRNTGRTKVKAAFDKAIKKYRCDLLADEKERIAKTKNPNKEKDMRLTKTDDKFNGPAEAAKPKKKKKKATKKDVTSPKLMKNLKNLKNLKTLDKKATRQIAKRTLSVKSAPKGKKRCSRCGKILPLTDFAKLIKSPDGKLGHCKVCECAYQKRRREVRPDIPGKPAKAAPKAVKKTAKKATKKATKKTVKKTAKKTGIWARAEAVKKTAR
jgi:hypothetical protein